MSQFENSEIVFNNTFQSVVCGYNPWDCGISLVETFHIIVIYCIKIHVKCYFWCIHIVARLMFVSSPTYLIMLELGDEKRWWVMSVPGPRSPVPGAKCWCCQLSPAGAVFPDWKVIRMLPSSEQIVQTISGQSPSFIVILVFVLWQALNVLTWQQIGT